MVDLFLNLLDLFLMVGRVYDNLCYFLNLLTVKKNLIILGQIKFTDQQNFKDDFFIIKIEIRDMLQGMRYKDIIIEYLEQLLFYFIESRS